MTYFNTTQLKHYELLSAKVSAKCQDEKILEFFKNNPGKHFSPDDILDAVFTSDVPITSARRSINTLTKGLFLEKTNIMVMGRYGKPCHTWKLKTSNNQPTLF